MKPNQENKFDFILKNKLFSSVTFFLLFLTLINVFSVLLFSNSSKKQINKNNDVFYYNFWKNYTQNKFENCYKLLDKSTTINKLYTAKLYYKEKMFIEAEDVYLKILHKNNIKKYYKIMALNKLVNLYEKLNWQKKLKLIKKEILEYNLEYYIKNLINS